MGTRGQIKACLFSLALAFGAVACGDDTEEATPPKKDGGDTGFTDPEDAARPQDARADSSSQSDGGTPREDGGGEDADTADGGESCEASEAEADEKDWAEGCYKCAPESNAQLLNSCATGWRSFDPESYPNGWRPGDDLPALP